VQPDQGLPQAQRQGDLDTVVNNSFAGNYKTFARENYEHYGAVIGKLSGTTWKFYLQANKSGQADDDNIVTSVKKR
jgi:hypothetical protein